MTCSVLTCICEHWPNNLLNNRSSFLQPSTCDGKLPKAYESVESSCIIQKLVELISALQTSEQTLERARAFAIACGKGEFFW